MDQITEIPATQAPLAQAPVKYRNLFVQVLLTVVTFGFYIIYWFYQTSKELVALQRKDDNVVLWTLLLFVPPFSLYAYYKHAEAYEIVTRASINRWVIFFLWIIFSPAVWIIVQMKLNEIARRGYTSA